MILIIFLLFIFGVFSILLEAVVPHGVSIFIGFGLIVFSGYLAIREFGSSLGMLYCVLALLVALGLARLIVRSGLRWLALKPPTLDEPGNRSASANAPAREPSVGDAARVVQPLRPTGTIEWEGRRLSARTIQPERESKVGAKVLIRGKDSTFWLVEETGPMDPGAARAS